MVEDDALVGELLAELLGAMGHHVCAIAETQADAVAAAAKHDPDFILMDIMLKQGDGVSAMRVIADSSHAPHVFMTGSGRADVPAGAVILYKPFGEADLLRALARSAGSPSVGHRGPA